MLIFFFLLTSLSGNVHVINDIETNNDIDHSLCLGKEINNMENGQSAAETCDINSPDYLA